MAGEKELIESILAGSGVTINGPADHDPQVHNPAFYPRVISQGSLGLGEAYMDGWWDCKALDEFFCRLLSLEIDKKVRANWVRMAPAAVSSFFKTGSKAAAFEVGQRHYDIGNDLYEAMLDKRLTYTCGYWKDASSLDEAQEAKLDLVCRKLNLKAGQSVLDIGSGWGCFIRYAAEKYAANTTGVTVSVEQKKLADRACELLPAQTLLKDYRDVEGQYDHVVSLGMFEHVGYRSYRTFMEVAHRALKDGGLFLLHTIGGNRSAHGTDRWISKYIFPNSMIPSMAQITKAIEGLFVIEDFHNFGADYDRTLMAWYGNIRDNWNALGAKYGDRFYRMWTYYLLSCAGSFRARKNQLWQIVLSKNGVAGGYKPVR
jgi:cyclopropane-fatty-acyl-phospholipid synthase